MDTLSFYFSLSFTGFGMFLLELFYRLPQKPLKGNGYTFRGGNSVNFFVSLLKKVYAKSKEFAPTLGGNSFLVV